MEKGGMWLPAAAIRPSSVARDLEVQLYGHSSHSNVVKCLCIYL